MDRNKKKNIIPSSFRDPSGFVFYHKKTLFRQINKIYKNNYDHLIRSGLYNDLAGSSLLIPHQEIKSVPFQSDQAYKIIKPKEVLFISYPYEWCFSQIKEAALATLKIQKKALEYGMSLKDASAFNIQFIKNKPVLIDTLSFEKYKKGSPWTAYRQFCQHFLAPLTLMSFTDLRLNNLAVTFIDGIPLDLTSRLLPVRTYFNFSLLSHIHIHSKVEAHFSDKILNKKYRTQKKMTALSMQGLIENLIKTVHKIKYNPEKRDWAGYYKSHNYQSGSFLHKKEIVTNFLEKTKPGLVYDLGANTGIFSRIASSMKIDVISFDMDPDVVELNHRESKKKNETGILPLVLDLCSPSPNIGWANNERMTLAQRGPADIVMALALIHHLALSNNLPFYKIAQFLCMIAKSLIIEFIPKDDSQAGRLLSSREDIFFDYTQEYFEKVFKDYFHIKERVKIRGSKRVIYLMKKK